MGVRGANHWATTPLAFRMYNMFDIYNCIHGYTKTERNEELNNYWVVITTLPIVEIGECQKGFPPKYNYNSL